MTNIVGPIVLEKPFIVYAGDSFKPQVTIRDGVRTSALRYGAVIDVSAATKKAVLTINKADGTSDVTRDTSVSAEGEKTDGANGVVTFFFAGTITTGWAIDVLDFEVEYQDTAPTVDDKRLVLVGKIQVLSKPSAR